MKLLLLLLFIGYASASSHEELKSATHDVFESFVSGLSQAVPLHQALGIQDSHEVRRFERDIKEELAKYLREAFDKALEKLKDMAEKGTEIQKKALEQLKLLREKMKDLNITDDEIGKDLLEDLKKKVDGHLRAILEKFGILEKRSIDLDDPMESVLGELNIRNFFLRIKEMVLEKMNAEQLKTSFAKIVGQGAQKLCEWVTNRGKQKVVDFFDRFLESDEERNKRSVSDFYDQFKEYFRDLDIDFKQKFFKFGEWIKEVLDKGLSKSKNKIDNVRAIARKILERSEDMSTDVAAQALVFLYDYQEELGELFFKIRNKLVEKYSKYCDNFRGNHFKLLCNI